MRAGELFSLYRVDHAIGFYRTYFAVDRRRDAAASRRPTSAAQIAARRDADADDEPLRRGGRRGSGRACRRSCARRWSGSAIPGYRVLRWEKDDDGSYRDPASWPAASVATNATHDTDTHRRLVRRAHARGARPSCARSRAWASSIPPKPFDDQRARPLLRALYAAPSTLALIPFQDALGSARAHQRARRRSAPPTGAIAWREDHRRARRRPGDQRAARARWRRRPAASRGAGEVMTRAAPSATRRAPATAAPRGAIRSARS